MVIGTVMAVVQVNDVCMISMFIFLLFCAMIVL